MSINFIPWRERKSNNVKTIEAIVLFCLFFGLFIFLLCCRYGLINKIGGLKRDIQYISVTIQNLHKPFVSSAKVRSIDKPDFLFDLLCQVLASNRMFLLSLVKVVDNLHKGMTLIRLDKQDNKLTFFFLGGFGFPNFSVSKNTLIIRVV